MRNFLYILFILYLTIGQCLVARAQEGGALSAASLDSLMSLYEATPESDSGIVRLCYYIAKRQGNVDSTIIWAQRLERLSNMHGKPEMKCEAYGFLSWAYYYNPVGLKNFEYIDKGIDLADSIGDIGLKAYFLYIMGYNYFSILDFRQADKSYSHAITLFSQISDTLGLVDTYRAKASNCTGHRAYTLANQYLENAMDMAREIRDTGREALCLCNLAENSLFQYCESTDTAYADLLPKARRMALSALGMASNDYNIKCKAVCAAIRAMFYELMRGGCQPARRSLLLDSIYSFCMDGYQTVSSFSDGCEYNTLFSIFHADYYIACMQMDRSRMMLDSIARADSLTNESRQELNLSYYYYYRMLSDYRSALRYSQLYYDGILRQTSVDLAVEASQEFQQQKYAEQDNRRAIEDQMVRHRWQTFGAIAFILLLFLAVSLIYVRRYNRVLAKSNRDLDKKNLSITSSLNYAHFIQKGVLPSIEDIKAVFPDCFIIFKPQNIVSGDFYWLSRSGSRSLVACADCTGHGVPGAFVSMLGISLLNEIAAAMPDGANASSILNELRPRLIKALGQDKDMHEQDTAISMEGMDIAFMVLDRASSRIDYAGAYRPLWIMRGGQLIQYRPDRMPIGRYVGPDRDFTNHEIAIEEGDIIYMFSDGITDQMGYIDDKRTEIGHFSQKRFADLVAKVGTLTLSEQKTRIETAVEAWRNGYRQLDDILMIGLKI